MAEVREPLCPLYVAAGMLPSLMWRAKGALEQSVEQRNTAMSLARTMEHKGLTRLAIPTHALSTHTCLYV